VTEPEPHTASRYWPRDAPIRWGRFFRGLTFQAVAVVAVAAHLVLAVIVVAAILGSRIEEAGEWLLAMAWAAGAVWQWWSWWFHRSRVVLAPVLVGLILAVLWSSGA
jgi:hypothetical protein